MPHVVVKLYTGRTDEQKKALSDALTKAVMETLGSKKESVSVGIEDVAQADWVKLVHEPDVLAKPKTIYKQPGTV